MGHCLLGTGGKGLRLYKAPGLLSILFVELIPKIHSLCSSRIFLGDFSGISQASTEHPSLSLPLHPLPFALSFLAMSLSFQPPHYPFVHLQQTTNHNDCYSFRP